MRVQCKPFPVRTYKFPPNLGAPKIGAALPFMLQFVAPPTDL